MSPSAQPSRPGRVAVVGSVNVDRSISVDRFPAPGETLTATSLVTSVGGKGANQALAAARSGAAVAMVGMVGDDEEGESARRVLGHAGVDCTAVLASTSAPTGTAWITVASGDNTIVVVPGANHAWPQRIPYPSTAEVVLCQLEIPLTVVRTVAAETSARFVLNAAPARRLDDDLLRRCEVLIVNEHELAQIIGRDACAAAPFDSLVERCRSLVERGPSIVVTTLGSRGALLCSADEALHVPPPPTPRVVDTTGAGDAFCGVFAARLAAGDPPAVALRYGVTAGSLSAREPTAQGAYDRFDALDALIAETPPVVRLPDRRG